ncbi:hypothetical protein [Brenneria tiliae]|uniref:hypothetical protein n=1 Tax=Brenneria tiliae TaxID=2914984 RepID=UPI0020148EFD|nr:hypothetical protein [Brenneria tiliae]MCL2899773.1 hypothetical protein [Brenneria tiliae]MCL2904738.1 hypothetical protein [Brenneria tiliae]
MARPRKKIETPGGTSAEDITSDVQLLNSLPGSTEQVLANTPEQLNAATAGATVLDTTSTETTDFTTRNEALSSLNAEAFGIVTKFESYGFVDEHGHPLTNLLDFIELVKRATTQSTTTAIVTEEGQRKSFSAPVLTEHGWHVK